MNSELSVWLDDYIRQNRYRLINSVLLYRDGELLLRRYYNGFDEHSRNNIKSVWKSILSICAGICLDKGLIKSLDDPVFLYLPMFNGDRDELHKRLTVRHLLTMTSGIYFNPGIHYHCPMLEQWFRAKDQLDYIADVNMENAPGTKYAYKEWDVILLSAVIAAASGMNTFDFCNQNLYQLMGIQSENWWTSPSGVCYNIGMREDEQAKSDLSALEMAKIGFLFLNAGVHNGQQIVSESYIKEALTPSPRNSGYGFLWWLFHHGEPDFYYGCRGFGGQEINIIPSKNLVYVIQATATSSSKSYGDVFQELIKLI